MSKWVQKKAHDNIACILLPMEIEVMNSEKYIEHEIFPTNLQFCFHCIFYCSKILFSKLCFLEHSSTEMIQDQKDYLIDS